MKTEKAIQVLRSFNKWRRADKDIEQPDPWIIGEAIDGVLMAIEKAEAERDLWKAEAEKWREIAIDLDGHTDEAIKRLKWRQDNLERGIKELKG